MTWTELPEYIQAVPEIKIGRVPVMGDCYYDGILDAHNDQYFITVENTIDEIDDNGKYIANHYESVFFAYSMDDKLRELLDTKGFDGVMQAREYVETLTPVGRIMEGDLERV